MSDNKPGEEQAEAYIKSKLIRNGFQVAKPSFDIRGADLLILDDISKKTTKFLRVQSKMRTVSATANSSVEIPEEYVDDNFILFLYIESGEEDELLFTFFKEDIRQWRNRAGAYWLTLSPKSVAELREKLFNKKVAARIKSRLQAQPIKDYTSILIDGIFLEKAIKDTQITYADIWPEKQFVKPDLETVVRDLLIYNQFDAPNKTISCVIFESGHHSLNSAVHMPDENYISREDLEIRIVRSSQIISSQLMQQLQRIINAENVMLVADDAAYETELNALTEKGVDLIILKQRAYEGSRMYTTHHWQDVAYALGRSIGLESFEI